MAGKKSGGENTKKVAGNAKKAEAAAQKAEAENQKKAAAEDEEWGKGAKNTSKKCVPSSLEWSLKFPGLIIFQKADKMILYLKLQRSRSNQES